LFDVQMFRRTKALECSKFAAAAMDVDDHAFGRDSPSSGRSLQMGQKRKRNAGASSALYRGIENFAAHQRLKVAPVALPRQLTLRVSI
jgi:hypothetical protein